MQKICSSLCFTVHFLSVLLNFFCSKVACLGEITVNYPKLRTFLFGGKVTNIQNDNIHESFTFVALEILYQGTVIIIIIF